MLTKEPEMLQADAFCEYTMQQNASAAGTPPCRPRWGSLQRSPDPLAGFKGASSRYGGEGERGKGKEGRGREGRGSEREEKGREGEEGEGRGGEVDCDAQLEQGRRLAKAGPVGVQNGKMWSPTFGILNTLTVLQLNVF